MQGVIINDKHIETILRQMLKKVEVKTTGDSSYLPGEIIDRIKFDNVNEKLKSEGKKPATGERVLMELPKLLCRLSLLFLLHHSRKLQEFLQMLLSKVKLIHLMA